MSKPTLRPSMGDRSHGVEEAFTDAVTNRHDIIRPSIGPRSGSVEEATGNAVADDPETVKQPSIRDILTSIRARSEAEGQSSGNAARPSPFARSSRDPPAVGSPIGDYRRRLAPLFIAL